MIKMPCRAGGQYRNLKPSKPNPFSPRSKLSRIVVSRDLKRESYGIDLLQAIGFVYASKAKQYLATNQTFLGVGGWFHNVQGKYHVFSET